MRVFIAEKNWEGCVGLVVTEEMKVTVAAQACLLVLGIEHDYFRGVRSILIYPRHFRVPAQTPLAGEAVLEESEEHLGEAWYRGPVVLSWAAVRAAARGRGGGVNTVIHEFAHQLDFMDGASDGTPPLAGPAERDRWRKVMTAEYRRLLEDADSGRDTVLDPYGTTNEAEFFAVAVEAFFDRPRALARGHPELYELLRHFFRQDPAAR